MASQWNTPQRSVQKLAFSRNLGNIVGQDSSPKSSEVFLRSVTSRSGLTPGRRGAVAWPWACRVVLRLPGGDAGGLAPLLKHLLMADHLKHQAR